MRYASILSLSKDNTLSADDVAEIGKAFALRKGFRPEDTFGERTCLFRYFKKGKQDFVPYYVSLYPAKAHVTKLFGVFYDEFGVEQFKLYFWYR